MATTPRKMIDPGARDKRIVLRFMARSKTAGGAPIKEPVKTLTAWAHVKDLKAQVDRESGKVISSGVSVFTIRYRTDLKESDEIEYKGAIYSDLGFSDVGCRNELLEITAKRRVPKNGN